MGSKNAPGKFDCWSKAEPDEPMFVLLGRDPAAAALVALWADLREELGGTESEVLTEARQCAAAMAEWADKLGKRERRADVTRLLLGLKNKWRFVAEKKVEPVLDDDGNPVLDDETGEPLVDESYEPVDPLTMVICNADKIAESMREFADELLKKGRKMKPEDLNPAMVEACARAAHEVNRAYCLALGDESQPVWDLAPDWQKESVRKGAALHLLNDLSPAASHGAWIREKMEAGWKFGPVKDEDKKEHPCFVPFEDLPREQRAKDYLFRAAVHAARKVWTLLAELHASRPYRSLP